MGISDNIVSRPLTQEDLDRIGELESFSGTDVCECGGKVVYSCKRNDGAEIGACEKCRRQYFDQRGKRLPLNLRDIGLD